MKSFIPNDICAKRIDYKVVDGTIQHLEFIGGCPGSLMAISQLIIGLSIHEAIAKLEGIPCASKSTSCPDQFAKALIAELEIA